MAFSTLQLKWIDAVRKSLPAGTQAWLVGGAVRDLLLERPFHDLDFVLPGEVHRVARAVAKELDGVSFVLDESRDTQRVILVADDGQENYLDFIRMNGNSIQDDLSLRDFTINALAVDLVKLDKLIDPLGGLGDLRARRLKACSPDAMLADPVRCLRGLRLANTLDFQMDKETIAWIRAAHSQIDRSAAERIRDELFQIFAAGRADRAIRVLDNLGGVEYIFPELSALKHTQQSAPHRLNAWEHSLAALASLEEVVSILAQTPDLEGKGNWLMSMVSMHLGRFREQINTYLREHPTPPRNRRSLLFFAALYHDAGKPDTATIDEDERRHFYRHERVGTTLVGLRGVKLAMSRDELSWLERVVANHMRIHHIAKQRDDLSPRAVYRFFRSAGDAGVAVCLLSLADLLATHGTTITREVLERELGVCKQLLATWWERPNEILDQPVLLDGDRLMEVLKLEPGPLVGELLDAIRLGQVDGRIKTREDGLALARELLEQKQYNPSREA